MELVGLEPTTSSLRTRRSPRLSYSPHKVGGTLILPAVPTARQTQPTLPQHATNPALNIRAAHPATPRRNTPLRQRRTPATAQPHRLQTRPHHFAASHPCARPTRQHHSNIRLAVALHHALPSTRRCPSPTRSNRPAPSPTRAPPSSNTPRSSPPALPQTSPTLAPRRPVAPGPQAPPSPSSTFCRSLPPAFTCSLNPRTASGNPSSVEETAAATCRTSE